MGQVATRIGLCGRVDGLHVESQNGSGLAPCIRAQGGAAPLDHELGSSSSKPKKLNKSVNEGTGE